MVVSTYRSQHRGPESALERLLFASIERLFDSQTFSWWCATSFPIGASRPDILLATYQPEVCHLSESGPLHLDIISYLYGVRRARPDTISARIKKPLPVVAHALEFLVDLHIAKQASLSFYLNPSWRQVLPRVVSIEVKVSNWRRAIQQAKLNMAFSHQSYIALPSSIASRVAELQEFSHTRIGLISIDVDSCSFIHHPVESVPPVPFYYFKIAAAVAKAH